MGIREKIEDKIRKKEQEIQEYEAMIRESKAYLQALQDAMKLLPREEPVASSAPGATINAKHMIRRGSKMDLAYRFLKEAGEPKYIEDILKGIGKTTSKKDRAALAGSLSWYVRQDLIFTRPSPGTYGLKEMTSNAIDEPPASFGMDLNEAGEQQER